MKKFALNRCFVYIAVITVLILSCAGATYAIFTVTTSQTGTNSVNALKCLSLTFSNQKNIINLENTYPMSDTRGKQNTPYSFTVTNNCGSNVEIDIGFETNKSSTLSASKVRTNFKNDYGNYTYTLSSLSTMTATTSGNTAYKLKDDALFAGASKTYEFKMWLNESVTLDEGVQGQRLTGKIIIHSVAKTNISYKFNYVKGRYTFKVPKAGTYQIEAWGASGGGTNGGKGAYTKGEISLTTSDTLYIIPGGVGKAASTTTNVGGFNGGGYSGNHQGAKSYSGGGASDIRLVSGAWNNATSLNSRIMVAAGGAGTTSNLTTVAGSGGGLTGYSGTSSSSTYNTSAYLPIGATQTGAGFAYGTTARQGLFGYAIQSYTGGWGGGGGGGYWGGSNGYGTTGSGGSSYISGHTGCVAITSATSTAAKSGCTSGTSDNSCSIHYSGKKFTNTVMIDGNGYAWTNTKASTVTKMPSPTSTATQTGNTGNGYVKITFLK